MEQIHTNTDGLCFADDMVPGLSYRSLAGKICFVSQLSVIGGRAELGVALDVLDGFLCVIMNSNIASY